MIAIMKWICGALLAVSAVAQTPVKPVPAIGVEVGTEDRAELEAGLARLRAAAAKLQKNPLLPDVMIYQDRKSVV